MITRQKTGACTKSSKETEIITSGKALMPLFKQSFLGGQHTIRMSLWMGNRSTTEVNSGIAARIDRNWVLEYWNCLLHYYLKHCMFCPGGGRGGYSTNVYTGRLRPEVQPLTQRELPFISLAKHHLPVLYTIFHKKRYGTPFVYLLLTNDTPFTYLV